MYLIDLCFQLVKKKFYTSHIFFCPFWQNHQTAYQSRQKNVEGNQIQGALQGRVHFLTKSEWWVFPLCNMPLAFFSSNCHLSYIMHSHLQKTWSTKMRDIFREVQGVLFTKTLGMIDYLVHFLKGGNHIITHEMMVPGCVPDRI